MIRLTLLIVLFSYTNPLFGQTDNWQFQPNLGLSTPVLDNGVGVQLGINPSYSLSSRFKLEGQLSFNYSWISGAFLSGGQSYVYAVNSLVGTAFYLNAEERQNRFYLNLLLGANYYQEFENAMRSEPFFQLGYSIGFYADFNKLILGLAFESPAYPLLKLGYRF
jgi:hypothetical protein